MASDTYLTVGQSRVVRELGQHESVSNAERRQKMMKLFQDAAKSLKNAEESRLERLIRAAQRENHQMEKEFNQALDDV